MFHRVMDGKAVRFHDFQLFLDRNGRKEECYFDFSYSPIKNEQGAIEAEMKALQNISGVIMLKTSSLPDEMVMPIKAKNEIMMTTTFLK